MLNHPVITEASAHMFSGKFKEAYDLMYEAKIKDPRYIERLEFMYFFYMVRYLSTCNKNI